MSHHILVVDDSATIRKAIDITFAHENFELTTVSSGQEALAALSEKVPDIALVDANLAQENGLDLARDMLAHSPGQSFPLVLLSSNHSPVDQAVLDTAGISSQVAKPFHTQELIDHVKTHLGLEVEKSVAAMRFIPRSARPPQQAAPEPVAPPVTAPEPAEAQVSAPPPVIKGPPPPAIKGPPPPAPAAAVRAAQEARKAQAPEPALITPPPAETLVTEPPEAIEAPAPALITPPVETTTAPEPALITPPPAETDFPPALITPAPDEFESPMATADDQEAPLVPDFDTPAVTEPDPAATELDMPPSLEVPELAPIPAPDAPTMVVRSVQTDEDDEPYQPEPTHSIPALTAPVTDLGLGIDLGSIAPDTTSTAEKINIADGEVDVEALMPVIEAAVRKVTAEVVERVVWEVVPDLAERLIREHLNKQNP